MKWAFPEAASVNFEVFYDAVKDSQTGQMLMIPFWYPFEHDDGRGRGIGGVNREYYKKLYEKNPSGSTRAADFGSLFLGTPIDYETEKSKKSLRLREQIARLRVEYEKGHISSE